MAEPAVSVLLPTIRPSHVARVLAGLQLAAGDLPLEVVVIADFPSPGHQPWIVRPRAGVVDAVQAGVVAATGRYLFVTNDETQYEPGMLRLLYDAAEARPGCLWSPQHLPPFQFVYYDRPFAPFPFAHRDVFAQIGGVLDPVYGAFYADPDLSLRAHRAGVPVVQLDAAKIYHSNETSRADHRAAVAQHFERDRQTFRARWDPELGSPVGRCGPCQY